MRDGLTRIAPWAAGAGLVAVVPGVLIAPQTTWTVLALFGVAMLVRVAVTAARELGLRRTLVRLALGASVGPWLALVDTEMVTSNALALSAVVALLAVGSSHVVARPAARDVHGPAL